MMLRASTGFALNLATGIVSPNCYYLLDYVAILPATADEDSGRSSMSMGVITFWTIQMEKSDSD